MWKRLWLLLVQAVTLGIVIVLVYELMLGQHLQPPQPSVPAAAQGKPAAETGTPPGSFRAAVAKAAPSVVTVYTLQAAPPRRVSPFPFGEDEQQGRMAAGLGSGVVVSEDGLILTNNHVIEGAEQIAVALAAGGEPSEARVLGTDPETDLAVLKIKAERLVPISFAPPESVQVGDVVLALGNPFGVGQTVTQGIVSATGRNRLGINTFENFIQTDASINPGNSGGALVDVQGRLVGINSAIFSESGGSQGIGFAIPARLASQVLEQITKRGRVDRGWLGVAATDVLSEKGKAMGSLVTGVQPGGPAAKAGLQPRDTILSIGGKAVTDTAALVNEAASLAPGTRTRLGIERGGKRSELTVELGRRPAVQAARARKG